jgi:hypothetical protein
VSEQAPQAAPRSLSGKRALVVVDEEVSGDELTRSLLDHLGNDVEEVFVVAPALPDSKLDLLMGAVDEAIPPARERLEGTLAQLREAGLNARGEVGDSDPIQAMSDEIVKFGPEQVVLVCHREGDGPAENELLEQAERNFDVPVLQILVNRAEARAEEPEVLDVQSTSRGADAGKGSKTAYKGLPELNKREVMGLVVAIVGTIVLGILTAAGFSADHVRGGNHEESRLGTEVIAMALISIGFALINLGHITGLLIFQGVRFQGRPASFMARISLYGTPVAILTCVVLLLIASN